MTAFGSCLCLYASIVGDVSGNLHSCSVMGIICGPGWCFSWWFGGIACQSTASFMFLLLKHSFPNWSSRSLHWSHFIVWSSARSFSLGNGVLHQKNYCHKKAKLFPGAFSGISNSSLSVELNFSLDTYSKQMQTSIRTIKC